MADPKEVDNTDARDQFIALGVGVIVGRCGRDITSAVSALTPPLLSWIGREWIVFPARLVVVQFASHSFGKAKEFVRFSVSPTLGLVGHPTMINFRINNKVTNFYGWVGPQSSGDRFALTMSQVAYHTMMVVIDTSGRSEDLRLCNWLSLSVPWCHNRRWLVSAKIARCSLTSSLTLWNLDGVESGSVAKVEGIATPWLVFWAGFGGDDSSLVVPQLQGVMVIDLEATFSQSRLVWSTVPIAAVDGMRILQRIILWNEVLYALLSGGDGSTWVQCLTTGVSTKLSQGKTKRLGGPYVAVCTSSKEECGVDVYSVLEPTKVRSRHRAHSGIERLVTGREMVFRDHGFCEPPPGPNTIEVVDAVTGFVIFKMRKEMFQWNLEWLLVVSWFGDGMPVWNFDHILESGEVAEAKGVALSIAEWLLRAIHWSSPGMFGQELVVRQPGSQMTVSLQFSLLHPPAVHTSMLPLAMYSYCLQLLYP
ncbi:hypothetical protein Pelo_1055 [Pelomyxa schiedti]|nr:hypothetical protein Pelo_1055 [Pelomyxa schiedti]